MTSESTSCMQPTKFELVLLFCLAFLLVFLVVLFRFFIPAMFRLVRAGHCAHNATTASGARLRHCCKSKVCSLANARREEGEEREEGEGGENERRGLLPRRRERREGMREARRDAKSSVGARRWQSLKSR